MKRRKQKDEAPRSGGELMTIIAHFRLLARFALIGRLSCHPRRAALVHDRTSPKLPERTAHRGLSFEEPKVSHAPLVESGDGILASSRYLSPCPSSHCLVLFCSWPDFLFITIDASRPTDRRSLGLAAETSDMRLWKKKLCTGTLPHHLNLAGFFQP